tara:strand:+ start:291 stop:803 length:513 start_codon:yes stop_codon:yes gene_type:complete
VAGGGTGEGGTSGQGGTGAQGSASGAPGSASQTPSHGGSVESQGGGSPGGAGTIICTELHRQGLVDDNLYAGDIITSAEIPNWILEGYRLWARPVVRRMRRSKRFTRVVKVLAQPVINQLANFSGFSCWSPIGVAMLALGLPICGAIGAGLAVTQVTRWRPYILPPQFKE